MPKKASKRGGYRSGAGRKPKYGERMKATLLMIPPAVVNVLDSLTSAEKSRSEVVLDLLAKAHKPIRDVLKK